MRYNSLLFLPTRASENHSQSCICSYFHLHYTCLCLRDSLPWTTLTPIYLLTSRNICNVFQSLLALNTKFSLLPLIKNQMGVVPKYLREISDFRPLPGPFAIYAPMTGGSSLE